ncbi:MAG: amidophosphoribosyltransferase [Lentimicrobiaceae bacterium]|nr:amidophosphoribosyltransferase [Lentimicrobiaceae bacterium]
MSDQIKHECGIALIRLLQPLEYYYSNYGTNTYAINKLHLLIEKQHNRGQDGAGVASIKFNQKQGSRYIDCVKSNSSSPINDVFKQIYSPFQDLQKNNPSRLRDVGYLKENVPFFAELYLGHLRYGTFGKNNLENIHPVIRSNNWKTRNLALAGNFNLTNVDELFNQLVELGQYPIATSDTVTILEKIGHFLDEENERQYRELKEKGYSKKEATEHIAQNMDIRQLLTRSAQHWDGGYAIAGIIGHGDAFVMRDPNGIRPAYWYADNEVVVATSERPAIQTTFNVHVDKIKEIEPGTALIIKRNGEHFTVPFIEPQKRLACSFERIYFSRGTDKDIYLERKKLGKLLAKKVLEKVNYDIENTVFSYIPNTAASAFYGMREELFNIYDDIKVDQIVNLKDEISPEKVKQILAKKIRSEKVAVKDIKLRTFIAQESQRNDLVAHVYDVTYGIINTHKDNLVVVDDSIVRGTTLKNSIIRILDRLGPKHIVIASSAPQVRYPDCYGIDMAVITDFIAFKACIELIKETKQENIINIVYKKCKEQEFAPKEQIVNYVKDLYDLFTEEQISDKIAQMITPSDCKAKISVVYQSVENLHKATPNNLGDWYFTGNYPTPGGNKVVNKSFINFIEGKNERAY